MHPKTAVRQAVLRALQRWEAEAVPLAALLESLSLAPEERAFARELISGVLRWQARLDWTLQPLLKKSLSRLDPAVRAALRLAAYETLMTRTPAPVAAHQYAGLMRGEKLASAVALVNAVARRLPQQWRASPAIECDLAAHLAIEHSHPRWLVERWVHHFGPDATRELCAANNQIAPLNLRANTLKISRDDALQQLQALNFDARAGRLSPHGIVIERAGSPLQWPLWTRGEIIAQDEAAQLVALLAAPRSGQIIVDVASAPGGKTTHLAQLINDQGRIIAADRAPGRLKLLRQNAARLQLNCIETFEGDALQVLAAIHAGALPQADMVLLDAPCSGTGTLRRRPDLKWLQSASQIEALARLQRQLLAVCAPMVRPGGALIYATCSLEPEENFAQAQTFLQAHPNWTLEAAPASAWGALATPAGALQTWPPRDGSDGMFAAKLRRRA